MILAARDADHIRAGQRRKLQHHVADAADAEERHGLTGLEMRFVNGAVRGDARTEQRRGFFVADRIGNFVRVQRVSQHVLGVAAVAVLARNFLVRALTELFARGEAEFAVAAGRPQRLNADTIADFEPVDAGTDFVDFADHFMAGDDGRYRRERRS